MKSTLPTHNLACVKQWPECGTYICYMMTHTFNGRSAIQQNTVDGAKRQVYRSNEKVSVLPVNTVVCVTKCLMRMSLVVSFAPLVSSVR